jgi:hypothetical protein
VRRLAVISALLMLALAGTASGVLRPTRTIALPASVTALSVTDRSIVYAVGRTGATCAFVELWDPSRRLRMRFGEKTLRGCEEMPSGGAGISTVSAAGRRVFWVTYIGGNITDWKLWTATTTRRSPRLLASASSDTDGPAGLVLGAGTTYGVPYAVGDTVTYLSDTGARLFRTALGSPVRKLTAGRGPGTARVLAALEDGRVVLLSQSGAVLRTDEFEPRTVSAIGLGVLGPVVQVGRKVMVGATTIKLQPGAQMLDYTRGLLVHRTGREVRSRELHSGADELLRVFDVPRWQTIPFSSDHWGSAWADGRTVSWSPWVLA